LLWVVRSVNEIINCHSTLISYFFFLYFSTNSPNQPEKVETTGNYKGLITIYYIDLFKNIILTKTIENQEIRINK